MKRDESNIYLYSRLTIRYSNGDIAEYVNEGNFWTCFYRVRSKGYPFAFKRSEKQMDEIRGGLESGAYRCVKTWTLE